MRESSPWNGAVVGVREWPHPGGIREQLAAHVEAIQLLTVELNAILVPPKGDKPKPEQTEPES